MHLNWWPTCHAQVVRKLVSHELANNTKPLHSGFNQKGHRPIPTYASFSIRRSLEASVAATNMAANDILALVSFSTDIWFRSAFINICGKNKSPLKGKKERENKIY